MNQLLFSKVISSLRLLQLYYHNCHNLVSGKEFHQDHSFFSASYEAADDHYDAVVEYMIATLGNKAFDTRAIIIHLAKELSAIKVEDMSAEEMYEKALELEQELQEELIALEAKSNLGLRNLIGDIAQASDVRKYKIQQRLN